MKDAYDSKAILHDPCTPTAVILTAIAPEIHAIMKHLEKVEEENVK